MIFDQKNEKWKISKVICSDWAMNACYEVVESEIFKWCCFVGEQDILNEFV